MNQIQKQDADYVGLESEKEIFLRQEIKTIELELLKTEKKWMV